MEIGKRTETELRISHNRVLYFKVSSFYRHELGIQGDLFVFFFPEEEERSAPFSH